MINHTLIFLQVQNPFRLLIFPSDNHCNMQRLPDDSSIFTAEAKAVDLGRMANFME